MAKPAKQPLLICPFTGLAVVVEELPIGLCDTLMYRARGPFWVTPWRSDKQSLLHDISHRNGVPPEFPRVLSSGVTVVGVREPPPPSPAAGLSGEVDVDVVDKVMREVRK